MRIAFAIHSLAGLGGTETYTIAVADGLQRAGHDVWIYGPDTGAASRLASRHGLRCVSEIGDLPQQLDVVLSQDMPSALEMIAARPKAVQLHSWHSEIFDLQLPPQIPEVTALVVVLSEKAFMRLDGLAVKAPVLQLTQPIDTLRFRPRSQLPERPRRALALGNYLQGVRLETLREACEIAGLELRQIGSMAGGVTDRPEDAIAEADIVFGKARVILEAMASGRAAYVYDAFGSDGWVTRENYSRLAANNFAGSDVGLSPNAQELAADLGRYSPEFGETGRDLVVRHHRLNEHCSQLITAIESVVAGGGQTDKGRVADPGDPSHVLFELARMSRVNWRHEGDAYYARSLLLARDADVRELQRQIGVSRAETLAEGQRADHYEQLADGLQRTTRWRIINALLAPFDRLRGRPKRRATE